MSYVAFSFLSDRTTDVPGAMGMCEETQTVKRNPDSENMTWSVQPRVHEKNTCVGLGLLPRPRWACGNATTHVAYSQTIYTIEPACTHARKRFRFELTHVFVPNRSLTAESWYYLPVG